MLDALCQEMGHAEWPTSKSHVHYVMELMSVIEMDLENQGWYVIKYLYQMCPNPIWIIKRVIRQSATGFEFIRKCNNIYKSISILKPDILAFIFSFCDNLDKATLWQTCNLFNWQYTIHSRQFYHYFLAACNSNITWDLFINNNDRRSIVSAMLFDADITNTDQVLFLYDKFNVSRQINSFAPKIPLFNNLTLELIFSDIVISKIGLFASTNSIFKLLRVNKYFYQKIMNRQFLSANKQFKTKIIDDKNVKHYCDSSSSIFPFTDCKHLKYLVSNENHFNMGIPRWPGDNVVIYEGSQMHLKNWSDSLRVIKRHWSGMDICDDERFGNSDLTAKDVDSDYDYNSESWNYELIASAGIKMYINSGNLTFTQVILPPKCKVIVWETSCLTIDELRANFVNDFTECVVVNKCELQCGTLEHQRQPINFTDNTKTFILVGGSWWWELRDLLYGSDLCHKCIGDIMIKNNLSEISKSCWALWSTVATTEGHHRSFIHLIETTKWQLQDFTGKEDEYYNTPMNKTEAFIFGWIWQNYIKVFQNQYINQFIIGIYVKDDNKCYSHCVNVKWLFNENQIRAQYVQWVAALLGQGNETSTEWLAHWNKFNCAISKLILNKE